jgi:hypothetical protein
VNVEEQLACCFRAAASEREAVSSFVSFDAAEVIFVCFQSNFAMADNSYNNNQGSDSVETQRDQGQQDFGVTDPTNVNTGVGPTGTDDAAPRDYSSEGPGMPKSYQGGDDQQGQYLGDQQQQPIDSGYGAANGGGDQQSTGAGGYGAGDATAQQGSDYQDPSAAAAPGSYSDKSAVGGTDAGTGTYDQPTSDQSQAFDQDNTGAAGTGTTPSG